MISLASYFNLMKCSVLLTSGHKKFLLVQFVSLLRFFFLLHCLLSVVNLQVFRVLSSERESIKRSINKVGDNEAQPWIIIVMVKIVELKYYIVQSRNNSWSIHLFITIVNSLPQDCIAKFRSCRELRKCLESCYEHRELECYQFCFYFS